MVNPEVTYCPPHPPIYHLQEAPEPRTPPFRVRVVDEPEHIVEFPEMEVGAVELLPTCIVMLTQVVVLQNPSALTQ